ncbi:hypothetical protein SPRG_12051 [Saprolegnia parasitica CBS 223.65]|uniref:Uncharacterized protein n=1 Tax=Saprolegnia parasitica (strain CBS 223.65) TaxID=695850 RepID=A0A067BU58_SAPPC|nr:hypothetical protein SPRG_12051 [Saprolegnia parasitica CBS 223.65]KDO22064.1 hypothetical protein SPRG_12051 [Saprolegnia parasitica CBS 223.65]|eukprot:XP_012207208.1 hypothetical protein SPRG_12051 [Saprolegnia parasitica CBS 223.65]
MASTLDAVAADPAPFFRCAFRSAKRELSLRFYGKNYLVDRRAFLAHLSADALVHTALVAGLMEAHLVLVRALADKAAGRCTAADACTCDTFVRPWLANVGRAVGYPTMTRLLEDWCIEHLTARTTGKLIKDIFLSSLRKSVRYQGQRAAIARLMLPTAARAALLPALGVFLVEQGVLQWQLATAPAATYWSATWQQLLRLVGAVLGSAVGAAIGTYIEPGTGTVLGAGLGQVLFTGVTASDRVFLDSTRLFASRGRMYVVSVGAASVLLY